MCTCEDAITKSTVFRDNTVFYSLMQLVFVLVFSVSGGNFRASEDFFKYIQVKCMKDSKLPLVFSWNLSLISLSSLDRYKEFFFFFLLQGGVVIAKYQLGLYLIKHT